MKYILSTLLALLLVPAIVLGAGAASTVFRDTDGFIRPLNVNDHIRSTFFVATSTSATSTFAGNVGIGTTTPTARLAVTGSGTGTNSAFRVADSANIDRFGVLDNGTIQLFGGLSGLNTSSNEMVLSGGAGNMSLVTSGSSGFSQFGSGRVGLGSTHTITWHSNTDGRGSGDVGLARDAERVLRVTNASTGVGSLRVATTTWTNASNVANSIYDASNGRFGIGTTTPTRPLEVTNSDINPLIRLDSPLPRIEFYENDRSSGSRAWQAFSTFGVLSFAPASDTGTAGAAAIEFNRSGSTATNIILPISTLEFGIGSTSPAAMLTVQNQNAQPSFIVEDQVADASPFLIDASGNVGIGTSTPGTILDVYGASASTIDAGRFLNGGAGGINMTVGRNSTTGMQFGHYVGSTYNDLVTGASYVAALSNSTRLSLNTGGSFPITFHTDDWVERMRIANTTGNVGIGTTNPLVPLQVDTSATGSFVSTAGFYAPNLSAGNVSLFNFGRSGTGGDTAQFRYFVGGVGSPANRLDLGFAGLVEPTAAFTYNGRMGVGTTSPGAIVGVNPLGGAPSLLIGSSTNTHLVLTDTGNFGLATTTPWRRLSVNGTVGFEGLTLNTGAAAASLCLSSSNEVTRNTDNETCLSSSARYKDNITSLTSGLDEIMKLNPVSFNYKKNDLTHYGLIAEEVAEINPLLVSVDDEGLPNGIRWTHVTAQLIKAVQEQQKEIDALKKEINRLKK